MAHRFSNNQKLVEYLGFGVSALAGLLIALGQVQSLAWALVAFLGMILVLLGLRTLVDDPGILGFWLLGAAILVVPWNAIRAADSVTAADLFLVLSFPFAIYGAVDRSRRFRIPWWLVTGVALLVASVFLMELLPKAEFVAELSRRNTTYQFQEAAASNLVLGVRLIFALAVFPLMAAYLVTSWSQVRILVSLWVFGVCLSCLVAVSDAFLGTGLQEALGSSADLGEGAFGADQYGQLGSDARYVGLTVHPVTLSLTAAMVTPVILARMKTSRDALLYLPLLLLALSGIILSGSRTGVILFLAIIVAYFLWRPHSRRPIGAAIAAFVGLLIITSWMGETLFHPRFFSSDASVALSNEVRIDLIREGISNIARRPLVGYGFEVSRQAHNVVLQLWLSGGLIALTGFIMVAFGYVRQGFTVSKVVPEWLRSDMEGVTVAFIVFLVAGLFGNYIFDRYLYVPVAIIMAAAGLIALRRNRQSAIEDGHDGRSKY